MKADLKGGNDGLRKEINNLGHEINGKLDSLVKEVQSLSERVGETEVRVGQVESWAEEATEALATCLEQQRALQQKLTDLESRSRRNNIRVFGVTEGAEENSVPQFIEKLLKRELPLLQNMDLKIQRAHRSLVSKPRPEAPPRHIIINFQEFTTKELVLREAWKKGGIRLGDRFLYFDHDYATEIVKKRKEYNGIKRALKQRGIRFQTPYTNIRIHWDSGVRTYTSAQEAQRDMRKRGLPVEETEPSEGENGMGARLRERLGWQQAHSRRGREPDAATALRERTREKLQDFQRERSEQR